MCWSGVQVSTTVPVFQGIPWQKSQGRGGNKGILNDGSVFNESAEDKPLVFLVGEGSVIPAFEQAVLGMKPGDTKTEKIPAEHAFGPYQKELVMEVERKFFPPSVKPELGQRVQIPRESGKNMSVTITEVSDEKVTLDANHPLAGKDLIFEIKLVEIEKI
jgi:FKBP-type peptidyl-prolyl cis-trans isomerase 2